MHRILFVEPREPVRKIYTAVLKPHENNWILEFASDARQAILQNEQSPFDIVVTPDRLPDRSGTDLLSHLKTYSPESIRFLLVDQSETAHFKSLVGPAQQILISPFDPVFFVAQLNKALALRALIQNPAILRLLGDGNTLPPLPRVFGQLTAKLHDPNSNLGDIAEIISQDVVMSSRVLQTVNSALFNLNTPTQNITHAVSLLGIGTINSLVFSLGVYETFKDSSVSSAFFEELNRHSIQCANLASKILFHKNASRRLIEHAMFCCFSHDLGKIVLAKYAPQQWADVLSAVAGGTRSDAEAERAVIGVSHAEIAAYLLAVWGFPNDQVAAVAFHHDPALSRNTECGALCALHLAEYFCSASFQSKQIDSAYVKSCGITDDDLAGFQEAADKITCT
jgi:HD-like signal output (HDOD) protein